MFAATRSARSSAAVTSFLDGIEAQIAAYLETFRLPEETVDRIVAFYEQARNQRDDTDIRRREIEGQLQQITELYKWGDLTKEAYLATGIN